jgi:hypothetical protein
MRIAISGTHRVGKSSLVEELSARLPGYAAIDEVYTTLEEEGYELSDPPAIEDFEAQLRVSIDMASELPRDAIVDRCPLDFVAYLYALDEDYDLDPWRDSIRDAMEQFDLVVLIRIAKRDRFAPASSEDARLRAATDEQMHRLVTSDALGLQVESVEVVGSVDARVEQVLEAMQR